MSEENNNLLNDQEENQETITKVSGMFKDWFLDYASYVILERAVPAIEDGFKPVQRRIMHSMKDLDDGRYNKVANIVGHTMQYHPHGDASIADAMVQIGQKDLLIVHRHSAHGPCFTLGHAPPAGACRLARTLANRSICRTRRRSVPSQKPRRGFSVRNGNSKTVRSPLTSRGK